MFAKMTFVSSTDMGGSVSGNPFVAGYPLEPDCDCEEFVEMPELLEGPFGSAVGSVLDLAEDWTDPIGPKSIFRPNANGR